MISEGESPEHLEKTGPPAPLDPALRDEVFGLIQRTSNRRFVAVYPVSFQTVAVNDGVHVNICVAGDLHDRLRTLLAGPNTSSVRWLVCDTDSRTYQICHVASAHELFLKNK